THIVDHDLDYLGECDEETVTVCHFPGEGDPFTLDVPLSELAAHYEHGDLEGPCSMEVEVCHFGEGGFQTIVITNAQVPEHMGHGDSFGPCVDGSPTPTPVPPTVTPTPLPPTPTPPPATSTPD